MFIFIACILDITRDQVIFAICKIDRERFIAFQAISQQLKPANRHTTFLNLYAFVTCFDMKKKSYSVYCNVQTFRPRLYLMKLASPIEDHFQVVRMS